MLIREIDLKDPTKVSKTPSCYWLSGLKQLTIKTKKSYITITRLTNLELVILA